MEYGIMFKAKTIIKGAEKYSPEVVKSCKQAINKSSRDLDFTRINKMLLKSLNLPIDIAVMEKTDKV